MKFILRSASDFQESNWSGGSTKQLYIFPKNASYADRNFQIRISTAKVEVPESTFTSLPGFNRKLMILEGEIVINHVNHHSKVLKPFDVDAFSGDWTTTAIGTGVDFNVMTSGTIESELSSMELIENDSSQISLNQSWKKLIVYVFDGEMELETTTDSFLVKKGNLILIEELKQETIELRALKSGRVITVKIG